MPSLPTDRKNATPVTAPTDVLSVLVAARAIGPEQVDRVRRAQKLNGLTAEQTVLQLGLVNEVQIAQALAAQAGLPYVKINPLDLDLDVVTKAIAGPFARRHGMVAIAKTAGPDHDRRPRPVRAVPARGRQARDRPRRGPRRRHALRRRDGQQGLLRPQGQPPARREAAHREPPLDGGPRQPGVPVEGVHRPRPRRGAGGEGARPHPRLRLRAARIRHPLRAQARASPWCDCGSTASCTTST